MRNRLRNNKIEKRVIDAEQAEELIKENHVTVNDIPMSEMGFIVDETVDVAIKLGVDPKKADQNILQRHYRTGNR